MEAAAHANVGDGVPAVGDLFNMQQALQQQLMQLQHAFQQLLQQQQTAAQGAAAQRLSGMKLPKPPETNGKQPAPVNWCHRMETYLTAQAADMHSSSTIAYAAAFLKDAALSWYRQHEQDVANGKQQVFGSWDEFKKAFIARFTPVDPEITARQQLDKLSQSSSAYKYAQEFSSCMLELPNMDEADRVHRFVKGLKPEVRIHVTLQSPSTLHDAIELAIRG